MIRTIATSTFSLGLTTTLTAILATALATTVAAQNAPMARADLVDRNGNPAGHVELIETPAQGVLLRIDARGLQPGSRAIHVHETGRCDPPDFTSAGGHFNPASRAHGVLHHEGMHAGDLLNLEVGADGRVVTERLARGVTLRSGAQNSLVDGDGTAIVIHVSRDDYVSQPTGDAGDRAACGVIRLLEAKP
jgi:superoxide dismutase, Cu-Zn family